MPKKIRSMQDVRLDITNLYSDCSILPQPITFLILEYSGHVRVNRLWCSWTIYS